MAFGRGGTKLSHRDTIGKVALRVLLDGDGWQPSADCRRYFRVVTGQVGSMNVEKIIAAIETASRREGVVSTEYPEDHALWHAIFEALHGVGRGGQLALGTILRTAGLRFSVVRGPRFVGDPTKANGWQWPFMGKSAAPLKGMNTNVWGWEFHTWDINWHNS